MIYTEDTTVMNSLYIVMPAYNEEDNIEAVIRQWYPKLEGKSEKSRLVIADSGSKDNTHNIIMNLKENGFEKIEILTDTNQYHGPKVIVLYKYAIKNGIDFIFQTDSDGQTNPDEFDFFWDNRMNYSGIFGNRTIRGDGKSRAFVEKIVCLLVRVFFGVKVPDANAPFRLMKTHIVEKYIDRLPEDYNIPNIMITTYFEYYKETILFKEISFKPRTAGTNSVNVGKILNIGIKAIREFIAFRRKM